jgi:hypothetical protein
MNQGLKNVSTENFLHSGDLLEAHSELLGSRQEGSRNELLSSGRRELYEKGGLFIEQSQYLDVHI